MIVTQKRCEPPTKYAFPKLMESKGAGCVVLFVNDHCGTYLASDHLRVGLWVTDLKIERFEDFKGCLEMKNEEG